MRYDNIDAIYSSITREQKEELLLSTFTSDSDRKHLFLINDVFGVHFEDLSNEGEKLESSQRVNLAASLVARFLSHSWLEMKYENQPWFLMYDGFQFVDPYSRSILRKVLELPPAMNNCVLLITSRPINENDDDIIQAKEKKQELEFWSSVADMVINLQPFTRKDTETLLRKYANVESVDSTALNIIFEKTDGNQIFVTMGAHFLHDQHKLYVEDGVLKVRTTSLDGLEIPASMASLWHHRIDRLDADTQLVLKVASACGMKFNVETLCAIFPESSLKQEQSRIVQILNDLVTQYKILELIDETKEKSFLCSSSSEKASFYKFKSSMIIDILNSVIPAQQKRELHLAIIKYYTSIISSICSKQRNREKSTWYISEIASHYGACFDKVYLEEILSGDQVNRGDAIYHVACAILFISKGLHLLGNHGAEIVQAKHLFTSLICILELTLATWYGERKGPDHVNYRDYLDNWNNTAANFTVLDTVLKGIEAINDRFERDKYELGITTSSNNKMKKKELASFRNKTASQTIVGMSRMSCKEFLSKVCLKYAYFLQALSDNNLMATSNNSLQNALKYCPKKNRELYFDIYCEIWYHNFYYDLTEEALVTSSELLNLANDIGAPYMQMYAYIACMMSHQTKGNFSKVAFFADEVINQYLSDPEKYHKLSIHNFRKRDALLLSCTFAVRSLWCMGRYEKAQYYFNLGTEHSKTRLHLPSFIFFYTFTCYYLLLSRQIDELEKRAQQGLQVMTIFSNNATLPMQELASKFYAQYVSFVKRNVSNAEQCLTNLRELRETICYMESLFESMQLYSSPNLIFNYAILECWLQYFGVVLLLCKKREERTEEQDMLLSNHTIEADFERFENMMSQSIKSKQENLIGELLRLDAEYQVLRCRFSSFQNISECYHRIEKIYNDAIAYASAQFAHGVKFRIYLSRLKMYKLFKNEKVEIESFSDDPLQTNSFVTSTKEFSSHEAGATQSITPQGDREASTTTTSIHDDWSQKIEYTKHELDHLLEHHIEHQHSGNHDVEQYRALLVDDDGYTSPHHSQQL